MIDPAPPADLAALASQAASRLAGISVAMGDLAAPGREPRPGDLASLASAVAILAAEVSSLRFMATATTRIVGQLAQSVADGVRADDELRKLAEAVGDDSGYDPSDPFRIPPHLRYDPELDG
jgi:hypothetical protein